MDATDNQLLNLIQRNFPLIAQPFEYLANQLDLSEVEVMQRIESLKKSGVIRRIGGSFNSKKLGYASTLCAMKVNPAESEDIIKIINRYPQVTHNYLREHEYNIWFTIIAESEEKIYRIIDEIKSQTGQNDLMNLPAIQVFKIEVNFPMK